MDRITSIKTLNGRSEGSYKDKGSKFLSYAFSISAEGDIKQELQTVKKAHPKARHHCYAYRYYNEQQGQLAEYANDAGEPAGSAGLPILNVLKSRGLSNAMVIVVRYFGGTKLGIPGLINAYKRSTEDALDQNKIVARELTGKFIIELAYEQLDSLYKLIGRFQIEILDQEINTISKFTILLPLKLEDDFLASSSVGMTITAI